jgi:uncharacterized protein (UPF0332 family)
MPFDWNTYKTLADELRQRNDEASQRSAISRLYYSIYWKARILLEEEDSTFSVPIENSHAVVWRRFRDKGPSRRTIFNNGQRLKEYRQMADYESEIQKLEDTVTAAFTLAENINQTLNSLSSKK